MTRTLLLLAALTACTSTSGVMPAEDGTYLISARAAPIRGGTVGADAAAFSEASQFCTSQGLRAVVTSAQERDVYQSAGGFTVNNGTAGGMAAALPAGNANLRFRCVR